MKNKIQRSLKDIALLVERTRYKIEAEENEVATMKQKILDLQHRKEMAEKKAIIISTHILEEVDAICTRAIIIAAGEILFDGTPQELRATSDKNDIDDAFRIITTQHYEQHGELAHS